MKFNLTKNKLVSWLLFVADATPLLIPTVVAVFGSVAVFFLILGAFKPVLIWPIGMLASAAAIFFMLRSYPHDVLRNRSRQVCNIVVIAGVLLWGMYNIRFTSQHVLVNRDPALYSNAGIWLTNHDNLRIPTLHVFGDVPGVRLDDGSGFKTIQGGDQQYVYAQGLHLLPAFIGLAGRAVGIAKALHINVLFGMAALLGIYAFGRELVRQKWWAVVATSVIAVSMPFIYVSRESFSEPLAATFTFGGLALAWLAIKSQKLSLWFLAGLVIGAGTLTRIDGFLTVAATVAFIMIMLCIASRKERVRTLWQSAAMACGLALTSIIGWLDVSRLSTPYYQNLHAEFFQEFSAIIFFTFAGVIGIWLCWRTKLLARLESATRSWRPEAGALGVLGIALLLASRPLWYRGFDATGKRTYSEISTQWVAWYIGAVLAVLGVIGIALTVARVLKKRDYFLLLSLLVIVATCLVYLSNPKIFPDQIWASRRLVPVILPGVAVFGVLFIDSICHSWEKQLERIRFNRIFKVIAGVALILAPLVTSGPVFALRPFVELGGINDMCAALPAHAAVLWVGDTESQQIVQPTRDICNVPSQGYHVLNAASLDKSSLSALAKSAKRHNDVPIVGVYAATLPGLPGGSLLANNLTKVSTFTISDLDHTFESAPDAVTSGSLTIELGMIQPDGRVTPLTTMPNNNVVRFEK